MAKTISVLCYIVIAIAVLWSLLAIGNGKVGTFFGTPVFIAAKGDMMAALVLNAVAAIGLLILGAMAFAHRNDTEL
jgi:hypothetical protein